MRKKESTDRPAVNFYEMNKKIKLVLDNQLVQTPIKGEKKELQRGSVNF